MFNENNKNDDKVSKDQLHSNDMLKLKSSIS